MVQRAKTRFRAVLSLIAAFFFSYFYKTPEPAAQATGTTTNTQKTSTAVPSMKYSAAVTQGRTTDSNTAPSNAIKLKDAPSSAAGGSPSSATASSPSTAAGGVGGSPSSSLGISPASSILYQMSGTREIEFQAWLGQQGVTQQQLNPEELKDAATAFRMEKILDRLDQIEKEINSK